MQWTSFLLCRLCVLGRKYIKNDVKFISLSRHSSFMIMHIFADWGRVRHNMAESLGITTVSTTKARGWNRDKGKGVGRNP